MENENVAGVISELIRAGRTVALIFDPGNIPSLSFPPVTTEELYFVTRGPGGPQVEAADGAEVTLAETVAAPLVLPRRIHTIRQAIDTTFSGDLHIAGVLTRAVPEIAHAEGFRLNPSKTRQATAAQRQSVTGLTVNAQVNIPRATYDQRKAILHHLARPDDPRRADAAFHTRLQGQVAWVTTVNPGKGHTLATRLTAILSG
jgi:hypothetical protein